MPTNPFSGTNQPQRGHTLLALAHWFLRFRPDVRYDGGMDRDSKKVGWVGQAGDCGIRERRRRILWKSVHSDIRFDTYDSWRRGRACRNLGMVRDVVRRHCRRLAVLLD